MSNNNDDGNNRETNRQKLKNFIKKLVENLNKSSIKTKEEVDPIVHVTYLSLDDDDKDVFSKSFEGEKRPMELLTGMLQFKEGEGWKFSEEVDETSNDSTRMTINEIIEGGLEFFRSVINKLPFNADDAEIQKLKGDTLKSFDAILEEHRQDNSFYCEGDVEEAIEIGRRSLTLQLDREIRQFNKTKKEKEEEDIRLMIEEISMISPKRLYEEVSKYVVGNEDALKSLSILFYNHMVRYYSHMHNRGDSKIKIDGINCPRLNGLIMGSSGSGKSYMVDTLTDMIDLPLVKIDANTISPKGFVGTALDEHIGLQLYEIQKKAIGDKWTVNNYLRHAVIYIDEFDKLGGQSDQKDRFYNNKQDAFLKIMDGMDLPIGSENSQGSFVEHGKIPTHNMLFIFSGSFNQVYEIKRGKKAPIGYTADHDAHKEELQRVLTREELVKHGMVRELLGRIHVLTKTRKLSRNEIKDVMFNVKDNVFDEFKTLFKVSSHDLVLEEEEISGIIDKVEESEYGMRYLKSMMFELLSNKIFELGGIDIKMRT